jgi:hypothetical protein
MIREYTDFLSAQMSEDLYTYAMDVIENLVVPREVGTNLTWPKPLRDGSGLVLCIRPSQELEKSVEDDLIEKGILDLSVEQSITKTGIVLNVWGRGSFLPEHTDKSYSKAVTVFLNKEWTLDHGGVFYWKDVQTGNWNMVSPLFNRAVINGEGIPHGVSPVQSDYRITLQIFVHKII